MFSYLRFLLLLFFVLLVGCNASKVDLDTSAINSAKFSQSISFSNLSVTEGDSVLVYFVLSKPAESDVMIKWSISGAGASGDFASLSGDVPIVAGEDSGNFTISSLNNAF